MKNILLKYEKSNEIKSILEKKIDTKKTIVDNSNERTIDSSLSHLIAQQALLENRMSLKNISDIPRALDYIQNSVEFGNTWNVLASSYLYASHYTNSGKIKIEIEEDLSKKLLQTKLEGVYFSDIIFPFNSFYLSVDFMSVLCDDMIDKSQAKIDGVYIIKSEDKLEITIITSDKYSRFICLNYPISQDQTIDNLISTHSTIKTYSYEEMEKVVGHINEDDEIKKIDGVDCDCSAVTHLVFSILLYLTSFWNDENKRIVQTYDYDNLLKRKNKKINSKKFAIKKANAENIIYLNHKKSNQKKSLYQNKINNSNKFFIVRGHWRKQPIGKKNRPETKIIWIEPYWKGEGDIQAKTYKAA